MKNESGMKEENQAEKKKALVKPSSQRNKGRQQQTSIVMQFRISEKKIQKIQFS